MGTGGEPEAGRKLQGILKTTSAYSGVRRSAPNGNQERDNPIKALERIVSVLSRYQPQALVRVGLPQKQMPLGKPRDTLTEAL
jgi:hypothetical protein